MTELIKRYIEEKGGEVEGEASSKGNKLKQKAEDLGIDAEGFARDTK